MEDQEMVISIKHKLSFYDIRNWGPYPQTNLDFKRAAVLLPITVKNGEVLLLLTKRSKHLRTHPSAVSFPGGMRDDVDLSDIHTALREAEEEIGLPKTLVNVIAVLTRGITMPNTVVYPIVGLIPSDFVPIPNPSEVEYAFFMPLKTFLDENFVTCSSYEFKGRSVVTRSILFSNGEKTEVIWGFTANFCILLANIIFESTDFLPIFSDSKSHSKNIDSDFIEYFNFIASVARSKL